MGNPRRGPWIALSAVLLAGSAHAQSTLVVDGTTVTLGGQQRYDHICVINGGQIRVSRHNGANRASTGNLELLAGSVFVDQRSSVYAHGRGYQARQCSDGGAPSAAGAGKGGCSVWDSGGGGAHFGGGGRGTVDLQSDGGGGFLFYNPVSFEDDCDHDLSARKRLRARARVRRRSVRDGALPEWAPLRGDPSRERAVRRVGDVVRR